MSRGQVEALLDALSGGWPWYDDAGLSMLLDAALLAEEPADRRLVALEAAA